MSTEWIPFTERSPKEGQHVRARKAYKNTPPDYAVVIFFHGWNLNGYTHWQPLDPPSKTDAFEEFCKARQTHLPSALVEIDGMFLHPDTVMKIWTAAINSTKG